MSQPSLSPDASTAGADATVALSFQARRVFLVLGSPGGPRELQVLLDGQPIADDDAGADVRGGAATISSHP